MAMAVRMPFCGMFWEIRSKLGYLFHLPGFGYRMPNIPGWFVTDLVKWDIKLSHCTKSAIRFKQ